MTEEQKSSKPSIKEQLVELAADQFASGRDAAGGGYLVPLDGPNVALFGQAAKEALALALYEKNGTIAGRKPLDEAWFVIHGALRRAVKRPLPLRVGAHDGLVVIDMGDELGRAITVDQDGWKIVDRSPITFARTNVTMPMVEPVRGGDLGKLWKLVNVAPEHRRMFLGWLIAALIEKIAHAVMTLRGEQGAAKSTAAQTIVKLLDPSAVSSSKPPKDEDRWDSLCTAHWIVSIDNVSKIQPWWSDDICRAVTGIGTEKRKLYTDDDVHAKAYRRCIILNGVTLGGMLKPDLLERAMAFDLHVPDVRLTDDQVDELTDELLPEIFGGLLDLTVKVLAVEVDAPKLPRMADFALLLHKLDVVLGKPKKGEETAVEAYMEQLEDLFEDSLTSDPVALAVIQFMQTREEWSGTTADLLDGLVEIRKRDNLFWSASSDRWWPDDARQLGNALTRSAPLLRQHSIQVRDTKIGSQEGGEDRRKKGKRLTRSQKSRAESPESGTAGPAGTANSHTCTPKEREEEEGGVHRGKSVVPAGPAVPADDNPLTVCPTCQHRTVDPVTGGCMYPGCRTRRTP